MYTMVGLLSTMHTSKLKLVISIYYKQFPYQYFYLDDVQSTYDVCCKYNTLPLTDIICIGIQ